MSDRASKEDRRWMELALEEGRRGLGRTSPNPPVGAVVVRDGCVISRGFHRKAGAPHAEIEAIEAASGALRKATLYVTLEPCSTTGRTPPCVDAIAEAGIGRVVYGSMDPNPRHAGTGLDELRRRGIQVEGPVCEEQARELIRFFAKWVRKGLPYIVAKSGMTLDGRITPVEGGSGWITGEAAREDVQRLRSEVDAILVGGETIRVDNPRLTLRGAYAEGRDQPWRVVVTRTGILPADSRVFTDEHCERTKLFHVEQLKSVFHELGEAGVCSVLLECGGRLLAEAFREDWVDEVCFYVAPKIGGGSRRAVESAGFVTKLVPLEVERFGPDLRIRGRVIRNDDG